MDKHEYLMLMENTSQLVRKSISARVPIFFDLFSGISRTHELCCAVRNMQLLLEEDIEQYDWDFTQFGLCRDCCIEAAALLGIFESVEDILNKRTPQKGDIPNGLYGIKELIDVGLVDVKFIPDFEDFATKLSQVAEESYSMLTIFQKICLSLKDTIEKFGEQYHVFQRMYKEYVIKQYWDYVEKAEENIIDDIENDLYTRNILENRADEPNARDWGKLLSIKLNELEERELREIENNRRPIDINDERVLNLFGHCKSYSDMELLFRNIVEINEIKYRTRPNMQRLTKPQEEEESAPPLPAFVNEKIRSSNQCNWLLREAIDKLYPQTGTKTGSIKWSHVQIVMEHREFIDPSDGPTDFAKKIKGIKTDIDNNQQATLAKNVSNNQLKINTDEKYWNWPQRNIKDKRICETVEEYFKPLMTAMQ